VGGDISILDSINLSGDETLINLIQNYSSYLSPRELLLELPSEIESDHRFSNFLGESTRGATESAGIDINTGPALMEKTSTGSGVLGAKGSLADFISGIVDWLLDPIFLVPKGSAKGLFGLVGLDPCSTKGLADSDLFESTVPLPNCCKMTVLLGRSSKSQL
jgi:hypothetical protein